jgi:hypothetical protein
MTVWIAKAHRLVSRSSMWAAVLVTLVLTAGPALAIFPGSGGGTGGGGGGGGTGGGGGGGGTPGGQQNVPEIGLGAAAAALTLLIGATLIAVDRRRREARVEPQQG